MHKTYSIILLLITVLSVFPQAETSIKHYNNLYHRKFGILEGIPSNEAYYVYRDKQNYLWICTDNGISRFDGINFRHYTEKNGLCSNVLFGCKEDNRGRLWAFTYTGELTSYNKEKDEFECPEFNDTLSKLLRGKIMQKLVFDGDTTYLSTFNYFLKFYRDKQNKMHFESRYAARDVIECTILSNDEVVAIADVSTGARTFDFVIQGKKRERFKGLRPYGPYHHTLNTVLTDRLFVLCGRNLLVYDLAQSKLKLMRLPFAPTPSIKNSDEGLMSGSYNNGYWVLKPSGDSVCFEHYLGKKNISCLEVDNQGGVWASSQTDGLYYLPCQSLYYFPGSETGASEKITSMIARKDTLFYLNYSGTLFMLSGKDNIHQSVKQHFGFQSPIIRSQSKDELFVNIGEVVAYNFRNGKRSRSSLPQLVCATTEENPKPVLFTRMDSLFLLKCTGNGPSATLLSTGWQLGRTLFSAFSGHKIYVGTAYDVIVVDTLKHTSFSLSALNGLSKLNARHLLIIGNDSLLVASSNGLHLFSGNMLVKTITTELGLSSNKVLYLLKEGDLLWVANSIGIDRVEGLTGKSQFRVLNLNRVVGLPYCQVTQLSNSSNMMFAATSLGIFSIRKSEVWKSLAPQQPEFKLITVKDTLRLSDFSRSFLFTHSQNQMEIQFNYFDYRNYLRSQFRYRLNSESMPEWTYTNQNSIYFPLLSPGDYELELQALGPNGTWISAKAPLIFKIEKPFTKSAAFFILILLTVLFLALLLFRIRLRQVKRLSLLQEKVFENRMLALTMQLNPHFVFNALNSVSHHIAQNNAKSALSFLGRFARLMRYIFRNSQHTFIGLDDELKALELYVELERVRLGKELTFTIKTDEQINTEETRIPALLLQPLVENAFWHGIGASEQAGEIEVTINKDRKYLKVQITDNGKGLSKPKAGGAALEVRKHSLEIIQERFALLREQYGPEINITLAPAWERKDNPGVRVSMYLPLVY